MPLRLPLALRALALAVSLAFVAQATGLAEAIECCADECATDEALGDCPPTCTACACAAPRMNDVGSQTLAVAPVLARHLDAPIGLVLRAPPMPAPDDVWHVPRRTIA